MMNNKKMLLVIPILLAILSLPFTYQRTKMDEFNERLCEQSYIKEWKGEITIADIPEVCGELSYSDRTSSDIIFTIDMVEKKTEMFKKRTDPE